MILYDSKAVSASSLRKLQDPGSRLALYNLPVEDLHAPIAGPSHPFQKDGMAAGMRNHFSGHVEDTHMNDFLFDEQYNQFHKKGYCHAPGTSRLVGSLPQGEDEEQEAADRIGAKRKKTAAERKAGRDAEPIDPTAPFTLAARQPWANKVAEVIELTEEQKDYMAKMEAEKAEAAAHAGEGGAKDGATSIFHGKEAKDYQGRSWLEGPKDKRCESENCYLPKRWIHTWTGHTKGVNAIRFFPGTGHLLLSAGLDGKVKIWDVYNTNKCMRTYLGHSKGVRDITFTKDGRRFISTGYDKNIRVWDTETGQVLRTLNTGKVFYCVTLHPDPAKQNVLMAGCHDKRIYQFDLETGDTVQEYNYHLGPVNTVTFIGERRVT